MDYKLRIKKFRDPNKGNWETTLSGGYENISGKIYDIKQYKEPDKIKDANGNPTGTLANNGYYSGKGELINLINPFTNPATNAKVTVEKIETDFEDFYGWGSMMGRDQYFAYIAKSISTNIEKKYKELFGIEISLTPEPLPEKTNETPPPPTEKKEIAGTTASNTGTTASNTGTTASTPEGPQIYGEFSFDVQKQDEFFHKDFGPLSIITKGVLKEEITEMPEEEMPIDPADEEDEYTETEFQGDEEIINEPAILNMSLDKEREQEQQGRH